MTDANLIAWISRAQTVAAFLVAIGVAGEFLGDFVKRPIEQRLDAERARVELEREHEVTALRRDSDTAKAHIAEAQRGAAEANERATNAQGSLALAEQHSAEANAKAEGFRLDIAKANERAAAANETAEREGLARLQLEARLADRIITGDQKTRLKVAFATIRGQTVDVGMFGDNPDIANVSGAILQCLQESGVLVNTFSPLGGPGGVRGVIVGASPDAPAGVKTVAGSVVKILSETLDGGVGQLDFSKLGARPSNRL